MNIYLQGANLKKTILASAVLETYDPIDHYFNIFITDIEKARKNTKKALRTIVKYDNRDNEIRNSYSLVRTRLIDMKEFKNKISKFFIEKKFLDEFLIVVESDIFFYEIIIFKTKEFEKDFYKKMEDKHLDKYDDINDLLNKYNHGY